MKDQLLMSDPTSAKSRERSLSGDWKRADKPMESIASNGTVDERHSSYSSSNLKGHGEIIYQASGAKGKNNTQVFILFYNWKYYANDEMDKIVREEPVPLDAKEVEDLMELLDLKKDIARITENQGTTVDILIIFDLLSQLWMAKPETGMKSFNLSWSSMTQEKSSKS